MRYKNNPLNIRYSKNNSWLGQLSPSNGFCRFSALSYGYRAAVLIIKRYRGFNVKSVLDIINRFAPPVENPTDSYISFVCNKGGFSPSDCIVTASDCLKLLNAMAWFEQGRPTTSSEFEILCDVVYENFV